jgi:hypothetical protein
MIFVVTGWLVGLLTQPAGLIHDEQALISRNRLRNIGPFDRDSMVFPSPPGKHWDGISSFTSVQVISH